MQFHDIPGNIFKTRGFGFIKSPDKGNHRDKRYQYQKQIAHDTQLPPYLLVIPLINAADQAD
jgi:hypothetical protein